MPWLATTVGFLYKLDPECRCSPCNVSGCTWYQACCLSWLCSLQLVLRRVRRAYVMPVSNMLIKVWPEGDRKTARTFPSTFSHIPECPQRVVLCPGFGLYVVLWSLRAGDSRGTAPRWDGCREDRKAHLKACGIPLFCGYHVLD